MFVKMKSVKEMKKVLTVESNWVLQESGGYATGSMWLSPDYIHSQLFAIAEKEVEVIKLRMFHPIFKFMTTDQIPIISNEYFVNIESNGAGI